MPRTYSISELAREMEVTTRTIRFYEEQGLLVPQRRGQERIYSLRDGVTLKLILRGKRIGFSLAECKELIGMYDPAGGNRKQLSRLLDKIAARRQKLAQQMQDIQHMQLELNTAEQRCQAALRSSAP
ncbi:MerR family DNA-binding transcriptional regulator [Pseudomonas lalucatii]|nr:MerR family DNA-binding transcriptional regulator [Pseudomonas lalucatii]